MKTYFNFHKAYKKFEEEEFTTIRGRSAAEDYKVGQRVDILLNRERLFGGKITSKRKARIKDIPLSVLQKDGEYKFYKIYSKQDFIDLINRFRRYHKIGSEDTVVTIFTIKKEEKLGNRQCPYCKRIVPTEYDFNEHKRICKNVHENWR